MPWQVPAVLTILIAYIFQSFLIKKVANAPGRARNLVLQYFFAATLIWLFVIISDLLGLIKFGIDTRMLMVTGICLINAFACYAHWRATAINMAVTSVSTWADDLTKMFLGYLFLHEGQYLNPTLGLGILFVFGSVLIFALAKNSLQGISSQNLGRIYLWIGSYSLIWGGLGFLMRYLALGGMLWWQFLISWYLGSFIGSCILFLFSDDVERGVNVPLKESVRGPLMLSFCIVASLGTSYWTNSLAPIVVTTPVFQVSEMIFPTLIGLYIYNEKKNFNWLGWVAMGLGLVGGLIIAFSF
ncbi:MAG: hypothetical protein A3I89_02080 [Candidatus Harrisonbacteria bacterium RIFCSPLOWO2_02_FULL_41_11]|uniref:EamA domain-containing protein n=1 Tax=Candidatus Harrisonbacteria bacterium RIFCSPHIGHO2_02_FULL_42_16 TaxID=1798404 RepID=A0A1G1ZI94_9BACT|nr:MAG: hypothetical protein A3B92_01690 [Candidatus Harrisonbacteria bacterium RIFCSPHIGHO2_02_FULL_42_16]OGY65647.1 MAG: hypothetical protein A3I89_02080 [Candidatus Harrisonbacteria bacterium RIFCSPLOWO2_02_FULL_41_11]